MVKIIELPIGTRFQFPDGFGVYDGVIFTISHIPDNKQYVIADFPDSPNCLQMNPDIIVVPYPF